MGLKKEVSLQIKNVLKEHPQGLIITDIVKKVKINRNTAGRYLENLLVSGQVEMRRFGMAKIYTLSQRVPLSALLSISSELVLQLDNNLRVIYANEPFLLLVGTDIKSLSGKNIEYTSVALVFEDFITEFIKNLKEGVGGKEWIGEILLRPKDITLFCRIAPTVFDDGRKGVTVILEDISQRKEAEQKVEESARQFRLLAENSLDMISRIKPDGTRIYVSPAYKTTLGYEPEELIGKNHDEFIHPNDAHIMGSLRNILKPDNPSATVTFRTKHKDGHYIWIESAVKAIFDENTRELSEYYTVTRDITQRKKEQVLLLESEDKYRKLVEISPDAVIIHQEGKISYINPAAVKLLGASSPDQLVGKNVFDFIDPDFRDSVMKNIEKDLKGEISLSTELHMIRLDGTSVIVEGRGVKTNIGGKPAVQVAIRDITDRKRIETELRESEAKYRTFIDRANDGIVVIQEGIIKICNRSTIDFWGGSINEIIGKNFMDFVHPDALPQVVDRYNRRMAGESLPSIYESVLKRKDGTRFYAELNAGIISYEGKPANLIIFRDINERKKIEEHLRKSENLYRTLAEASNDLIFVIDRNDKVEYVNSYAAAIMNKTVSQIIGSPRHILFPPEVAKNQKTGLQTVFETGTSIRSEGPLAFAGQTYWFDHILIPLRDADNHIRSVLGISRDITERRRMEEELQESEEKYRSLVNRAKDVVCIIQDGIIKMCNPRLAEFWGGSFEEIIGRNFADFIHPEALPEVIDRYNRRMAGESPPSLYETVFMRKDGSKSYVELNAGIVTYEGKNADLVIVRDINERKNATQAIRESEEKYRSLVTTTGDVIWETDDKARFIFVSPQVESIIGFKPDELIGHTPFEFLKPDAIEPNRKMFGMAIENKEKSVIYISQWIHKNGYSVFLESHAVPVYRNDGSFSGFIGIDRKKTL
jgi:PAS domain S-box-containing protein